MTLHDRVDPPITGGAAPGAMQGRTPPASKWLFATSSPRAARWNTTYFVKE